MKTNNLFCPICRPQCEAQVKGFTSPIFRKFNTYDEAVNFVISNGGKLDHKLDKESNSTGVGQKRNASDSAESTSNKTKKRINDDASDDKPNKKSKKDNGEIPVKRLTKYGKHSFMEDEEGYVHVFTDGSCEGNGTNKAVAGLGVYFGESHALYVKHIFSQKIN